jgi:hypothetical protein
MSNRFARMVAFKKTLTAARKRAGPNAVESLRLHQATLANFDESKRQLRQRKDGTLQPRHPEAREVQKDARSWIKAMSKPKGFQGHLGAPLVRPKGIRKRILGRVARKAIAR